jgi:carbon-monoxide dehydrogenase medium subunit
LNTLALARPADLSELAALMAGPLPVHFMAGGTDLLVSRRQLPRTGVLADLSAVTGLAGIDCSGIDIRIGAATTVAAIETHSGLAARCAALVQAAAECGSMQIRNRATLGGNIANAAPAADLIPVLTVAGARLEVMRPGGARADIALHDFRADTGTLITTVVLPGSGLLPQSAFAKLGPRRDLTIARLNLAVMAEFEEGRFGELRLAAGAVAPRPIRLNSAEAVLAGRPLATAPLRAFLEALSAEIDAAIPGRASRGWKRRAIRGLGLDLIARLCGLWPRDPFFDEVV